MIKTVTDSSFEHLVTYKILFLFNESLKSCSSLYFSTFSVKPICHGLGLSKAFITIYYFPKSHCHILGPSKMTRCSIFNCFWQILIATTFEPQALRILLGLFFEACYHSYRKLPKKSYLHIEINCIEINTLFAILNKKQLRSSKVRSNHDILKGMDAG